MEIKEKFGSDSRCGLGREQREGILKWLKYEATQNKTTAYKKEVWYKEGWRTMTNVEARMMWRIELECPAFQESAKTEIRSSVSFFVIIK